MVGVETVHGFPPDVVAFKIAVSLAIGMLVGFERESASKDVGIRTFGLTALLGAVSVLISPGFGLVALIGVFLLVALLNVRSLVASQALEITTSVALMLTFALGALVGLGHSFTPVAAAILMTLLLAWKVELRKFAGGVTMDELRSAVLLGLIGLVIYPTLPDRFIDRWQLVDLREAWITVVVIAGIAFANYVLLRLYGRRGLYWTAALGGLVNNRAAIAELMNVVSGAGIVGVVLLATLAMFLRNIAIQVISTLAERHLGHLGFIVASGFSGMATSASATAAAANLSAHGKITPALAGTAAVVASMASALTNLPLVFKRVPRLYLSKISLSTALQVVTGLLVLAVQHLVFFSG